MRLSLPDSAGPRIASAATTYLQRKDFVHENFALDLHWDPARPRVMVIGCSDGRLQEPTDEFLSRALGIRQYDRLYVPGGAGALSSTGAELMRAQQFRRECSFLVESHGVEHLVLLFHGPAPDGPPVAICADYQRKFPRAHAAQVRARQEADTRDLLARRAEFAGSARLSVYRIEVTAAHGLTVVALFRDGTHSGAGGHADTKADGTDESQLLRGGASAPLR